VSWLDWSGLDTDPEFLHQVKQLLHLRRELPYLSKEIYLHGRAKNSAGWHNIEWLNPAGKRMRLNQWHNDRTLTLLLPGVGEEQAAGVAIMFSAADESLDFHLPNLTGEGSWKLVFHSMEAPPFEPGESIWRLESRSIACAVYAEGIKVEK
jgi:pullulanase/glycogen debranching enzyme